MIAEIVCVGTEVLMGQVVNTNAAFLARRLSELGYAAHYQTTVGDNPGRLADTLRLALSRADIVITTGGLGPTGDDITKRVAAGVLGKPLVLREEALAMVKRRFLMLHREMPDNNIAQAMFTADSQILPNPDGTAPGALVPAGEGRHILHLPGPPGELTAMFDAHAAPILAAHAGRVLESNYIRIFGMGESEIAMRLADLMEGANPTLSPYCGTGETQLRLTASAKTAQEARALLAPVLGEVQKRLGGVIYAVEETGDGSMAKTVVERLSAAGQTLACAESLTGGLIGKSLTDIPGASRVFLGGVEAYSDAAKTRVLGVNAQTLREHGAVSAACAREMAQGARALLGADYALAATGYAGPQGAQVGLVYVACASRAGTRVKELRLTGKRGRIRILAMLNALAFLLNENDTAQTAADNSH